MVWNLNDALARLNRCWGYNETRHYPSLKPETADSSYPENPRTQRELQISDQDNSTRGSSSIRVRISFLVKYYFERSSTGVLLSLPRSGRTELWGHSEMRGRLMEALLNGLIAPCPLSENRFQEGNSLPPEGQ